MECLEKHLEDMYHVIGMLGKEPLHQHLQDMCHVIGMNRNVSKRKIE